MKEKSKTILGEEVVLNRINKQDLVRELAHRSGFTNSDCEYLLTHLISIFYDAVASNTEIIVQDWLKLSYNVIPARKGYDLKNSGLKEYAPVRVARLSMATKIRQQGRSDFFTDDDKKKGKFGFNSEDSEAN